MNMTPAKLAEAANFKRSNRPYTQLYNAHIPEVRQLLKISPAAVSLLLVMIEFMGKKNALVASISSLMKISGSSKSTVIRALDILEKSKFIQRAWVETAPVIFINDQVVWTDKPEFRGKMATFEANVITFDDEQPSQLASKPLKLVKLTNQDPNQE